MSVREIKKARSVKDILRPGANRDDRYFDSFEELDKLVKKMKKQGLKIVLTQGVFDLIHEGHAKYLEMAKAQGDVLIVGLDSDELTRARKGKNRPVVPEAERIEMLVHLRHVDVVVVRHMHHDIGDLIRLVKPDVLVTSSSTDDMVQKDYKKDCGKILTLQPQATTHTSARIRNLTIEGAEKLAEEINELTREFIQKIRKS